MPHSNRNAARRKTRFSEDLILECLHIMQAGDIEEMFEIIPRIGVLRDARFRDPLLNLLHDRDLKRREFAAYAIGAMRMRDFLEPLKGAFQEVRKLKGSRVEEVQLAVIEAIGALGDDAAVEFFLPMLRGKASPLPRKTARRIIESLGAIAQQGGKRSIQALLDLTGHEEAETRTHSLSELSVAFWHRPQELPDEILNRIHQLAHDRSAAVAESAVHALQSLADVGCKRAEKLFSDR